MKFGALTCVSDTTLNFIFLKFFHCQLEKFSWKAYWGHESDNMT